jgi:hypothetical protein
MNKEVYPFSSLEYIEHKIDDARLFLYSLPFSGTEFHCHDYSLFSQGPLSVKTDVISGFRPAENRQFSGDFILFSVLDSRDYTFVVVELDDGLSAIDPDKWKCAISRIEQSYRENHGFIYPDLYSYPDLTFKMLSTHFVDSPEASDVFRRIDSVLNRAVNQNYPPLSDTHLNPYIELAQQEALRAYIAARNAYRFRLLGPLRNCPDFPWFAEWINGIFAIQCSLVPKGKLDGGLVQKVGMGVMRSLADTITHWEYGGGQTMGGVKQSVVFGVDTNAPVDNFAAYVSNAFGDKGTSLVRQWLYPNKVMGVYATFTEPGREAEQFALCQDHFQTVPLQPGQTATLGGATDGAYQENRDLARPGGPASIEAYKSLLLRIEEKGIAPVASELGKAPSDDYTVYRLRITT